MAQPKPYPGDAYINQLIVAATADYLKKDANRNWILGINPHVDEFSVGNTILKDNITVVKSHDNILAAKNIEVYYTSGITANGADHIVNPDRIENAPGDGANYSTIEGDGHLIGGYGSFTKGFGCKNFIYLGICEGQECILGRKNPDTGKWNINEFRNSTARGKRITIEGNDCVGIGENFVIRGDNITVIGIGIGQTFTEPGVYILNQK